MEYQRSDLPIWVQGWLQIQPPTLVFIAKKTEEGPYLVDASDAAKEAFHQWTGSQIPVLEQVEEHKEADKEAWQVFANQNLSKLSQLVLYKEEIAGSTYETIKIPISDEFIVILTRPI